MMTVPIIKSVLTVPSASLRAGFVLALTPVQRWEAARNFNSIMTDRWFIVTTVVAIVILIVLFVLVSLNRARQQREAAGRLFAEYANERGLSTHERQVLIDIANEAGLKSNESIFTLASAFDQGVARFEESHAGRQAGEESSQLRAELSRLREKLGFKKLTAVTAGATTTLGKLSSRQIPVGKKVHMTRRKARDGGEVESTITRNGDTELEVRLDKPVKITFGEFWCIRYYFGSSVWEFDTSVVSYDGDILVLSHSDNVRFINRRRFLRVPVRKPAFIAHFPFVESSERGWVPPEFIPAVVTELAGPGLLIEAALQVKTGERVLILFNLDEEQDGDSATANAGTLRIIEDVGVVRHIKSIPDGMSIAVELTGLSDLDIDELVQVTNAALVRVKAGVDPVREQRLEDSGLQEKGSNEAASTSEEGHDGQLVDQTSSPGRVAAQGNGA